METSDNQALQWLKYIERLRTTPDTTFSEQWARYNEIFADRDPTLPPPPAWVPDADRLEHANITTVMRELGVEDYRAFHSWTRDNRADFWDLVVRRLDIQFSRQPDQTLDLAAGPTQPRWFPGARAQHRLELFPGRGL